MIDSFYKLSNFTLNNIDFEGNTEKDKFFEDGRFIITKLIAKYSNNDENEITENYLSKDILKGKFCFKNIWIYT